MVETKKKKPLIIVGAGGLGREVAWLVEDINKLNPTWELRGFVDDEKTGLTVEGYQILGNVDILFNMDYAPWAIVAIADPHSRKRIVITLQENKIPIATLIHPSVQLSRFVSMDEGSIVCAGAVLTTNIKLGISSIVNPNCFIGHDTVLNDFISIMPGAKIAGEVTLGEGVYVGLNACVINRTSIGKWSVIGAGATVVDDIPDCCLAVGVPARVIRYLDDGNRGDQ